MVQPLRFGLIGCGQQGREHIAALGHVAGAQLVACSDPAPESLAAVEGGPEVARFADFQAMLEQTQLDAVIVATTHDVLADATLAALHAGCHVFCEKPLATSADARAPGRRSRASEWA